MLLSPLSGQERQIESVRSPPKGVNVGWQPMFEGGDTSQSQIRLSQIPHSESPMHVELQSEDKGCQTGEDEEAGLKSSDCQV